MRNNPEYQLYRQVSTYLKYQYPKVLYHWDPTGLNLSKAQSGMLKSIQHSKGYPDLIIFHQNKMPMFLELKPEGTKLYRKDGLPVSDHIGEQLDWLVELKIRGFKAEFAVGFDECKILIDNYLNGI